MNTQVKIGNLILKNPIITASGTFGYGLEFVPYGKLEDLGGLCVKGLSLKPRLGNAEPRIVETASGMLNAIGLQNMGAEKFIKEILPILPYDKTAIIVNFYAQSEDEFAQLAEMFCDDERVAAFEINISCPNVREGGSSFGQNSSAAAAVTKRVKKSAGQKPIIVKLTPNVTDIRLIARVVEDEGADALSLINTVTGMAVDLKTRKPMLANITGGLSGPAIKPIALRMVYEVCKSVSVPVIGIGGIMSAEDVLEFILVGASAVQVGTANLVRPDSAFNLVRDLPKTMQNFNITDLEKFRKSIQV